jgi:hypothetical protein
MVIEYLNVFDAGIRPAEADAPLIVDANRVLAFAIADERLKAIPGWDAEIAQSSGDVDLN